VVAYGNTVCLIRCGNAEKSWEKEKEIFIGTRSITHLEFDKQGNNM
jgi:hypothetical protein